MMGGGRRHINFGRVAVALFALLPGVAMAAGGAMSSHEPAAGTAATSSPPGVAWCADFRPGALSETEQLRGANLMRLRAAQSELAPGFIAEGATTGLRLLAAYQEELGKARPSVSLAASYLAQVSALPLTVERYRRLNALLCVSTPRVLADRIRSEAEAQREQMVH